MFTYNISRNADNKIFLKVCEEIENYSQNLVKENPIIDVDGSILQIYLIENKEIKVFNDYEVDAVYVDSEIDLGDI